jgi:hypothetical protein
MPRPTRLSVRLDTRRAAARGSSEPRSVNAQDERRGDCPRRDRGEDPRIRHQHTLALLLALATMDSKRSQKRRRPRTESSGSSPLYPRP